MYLGKPMCGHTLMRAIARVNRVFKDNPGGLVVDYIGIANELKAALREYADSAAAGEPIQDVVEKALPKLQEQMEIARGMIHGFDYSDFESEGYLLLGEAAGHILGLPPDSQGRNGKERFANCMSLLAKAHNLCGAHPNTLVYRDEIAFLEAMNATVNKSETVEKNGAKIGNDSIIRRSMSHAIASEGVQDLFTVVGLDRPNIGVL